MSISMENQNTEWKQNWRDEYLKWICGFANAQGGKLFIGINDQGDVVGIKNAKKLSEDIPNKVRDILGIIVDVNLLHENDVEYIEIIVGFYPYPVSFKGQYHYRSGSTKQELKGASLDKFLLQKQGRTWDSVPILHVAVDDLTGLDGFRKLALKSGRLDEEILKEEDENFVGKLRLFDGDYLNRASILLFHPDSEKYVTGAYVKIGFFESDSELLYQDEVHGVLFEQIDKVMDLLTSKYLKAKISYEDIHRIERFPVPKEALREALLNAIAHKDYSSGVPIQISVYDDKLLIWNNGQLYTGWTVDNLLTKHASQPFNPDIANAFFRAGLIEAWGRGIEKMYSACKQHGASKPVISVEEGGIWVRFNFENIQKTPVKTLVKTPVKTPQLILSKLKENSEMTLLEIAKKIGKSLSAVERAAAKLVKEGKLTYIGPKKGGYWQVMDE
ncbi:MAG: putative DNA binding domain-containing protein [Candidatus Marinimicrobia bacterium]|nr:putative DNA binding domain-containing protein [Candidatus Neomarinimicrobiota bacterium]